MREEEVAPDIPLTIKPNQHPKTVIPLLNSGGLGVRFAE
jgi:hypothetical protein